MQIVINISKDDYEEICIQARMVEDTGSLFGRIRKAISHGVQLSKGHGRLVDADEILNHAHIEEDEDGDIFVKKWYCIEKDVFDNALVLIDGEVEE
jgi:hypothetical protein